MSMCSVRVGHLASARGLGAGPTAALPPPGALSLHLAARATAVGRAATRAWHLKTRSLRPSLSNFHGCAPLQNTLQRHGDALGDWTLAREKSGRLRTPRCQRVGSTVASHCAACQPPFRSGRPLPPTREVCTRTPAAALKAKLCGLPLQAHRHVERGLRDRARTENALWHGSYHSMGTAARRGLSLPVRVLAGRVTTLRSCEFCE